MYDAAVFCPSQPTQPCQATDTVPLVSFAPTNNQTIKF
jgi:hypothetical protein